MANRSATINMGREVEGFVETTVENVPNGWIRLQFIQQVQGAPPRMIKIHVTPEEIEQFVEMLRLFERH